MNDQPYTRLSRSEYHEIAEQAKIELAILLRLDESIRSALRLMTRDRANNHKLSTIRFHTNSFERHFTRISALADHNGYMHVIVETNPNMAGEVDAMRRERQALHDVLNKLIVRLERISGDDNGAFKMICIEVENLLDDINAHGKAETELLQRAFVQEFGGSG